MTGTDGDRRLVLPDQRPAPACTLHEGEHDQRITEWHKLLENADRTDASLMVTMSMPIEAANRLVELVVAEQQCCSFLGFTLDFHGGMLELRISAPSPDALAFVHALLPEART